MYTREQILSVIDRVYDDSRSVIVGEQCNAGELPDIPINRYAASTGGHYPAILGIDLACYGLRLPEIGEGSERWNTAIDQLTAYAEKGGIITASSHLANPLDKKVYCNGKFGGPEMWEEMATEGTEINKLIKEELLTDGRFLKELDDRGIPVLWRPLHEMNGGWFWFCGRSHDDMDWIAPEYFKKFWKYIYELYTKELGMKHLIWVYGPNVSNHPSMMDAMYYYPGDEYVDILGLDWYTGGNRELNYPGHSYDLIMSRGKPCALTEFGLNGQLLLQGAGPEEQAKKFSAVDAVKLLKSLIDQGIKIAYVLTWTWGCGALPTLGRVEEALADPFCIDLDRLRALYK